MSENILYEATFKVDEVNSAKYDRVSRIAATNEQGQDTTCFIDVNTELYPVEADDRLSLALALSLNLDGSKDDSKGWRNVGRGESTIADDYDYVMHGKIYRFEEGEGQNIKVYISFGGLLMYLDGPYNSLAALRVDYVYLLMKK
ncbi:DNA-directed RNA polymerases I, II, and III subunit RPABC3 [Knufia obscura]|uniref:DNA-directed RNA polymerases I, II, and III subunit RPABC3 n=2 Tax=Knufia TaxID=430999 RepID=A0AAN8IHR2_9EURO|nr:DNA-directed RNA polymerases I, II, and III subunit RPABC3 [Knufia obscura]KAK5948322.1 DNA-directed RNA polymerases I, II, and III subunit RPABC3 [Knufia fluminis]